MAEAKGQKTISTNLTVEQYAMLWEKAAANGITIEQALAEAVDVYTGVKPADSCICKQP
ncbi:MAG: hypothetical protein HY519_02545 [Candidatus Aenigmarchaeota archaeon]|nr:hypothetical protein [Candidatus Aenigmarchaeota archaeon]